MPEHCHGLLRGLSIESDIREMIARWKQSCGYWYSKEHGDRLWLSSYWDYVLRADDDPLWWVYYTLMNSLRAGLVNRLEDYRWFGSSCWSREDLLGIVSRFAANH
jgi:putative transposase